MGKDLQNKLKMDIDSCCYFSFQCDESVDIMDTSQTVMFIRMSFPDMSYKEKFLTVICRKGTARDEYIYQHFVSFAKKPSLPVWKLVCIANYGAPPMVGKNKGFLHSTKKMKFHFVTVHCVMYQNAL